MAYSFRAVLKQIPHFVIGFCIGIVLWKWMGEDMEENIVGQAITHIAMVLGYRYARSQANKSINHSQANKSINN